MAVTYVTEGPGLLILDLPRKRGVSGWVPHRETSSELALLLM